MLRISCYMLLCCKLIAAFPYPADPVVAPGVPVPVAGPTPFPFASAPRPGVPGYNSPYHNYPGGPVVPIVAYSSEHGLDGTYAFSFATGDGKLAQENGFLKDAYIDNAGDPQGTQVVQGSYSYVSPEGTPIQVSYVADENGFRPSVVHIPADGKAIVPPIVHKEKQIYDPLNNRYDPYYNRNGNPFGQYNGIRPYDPRYSYDPRLPYDHSKFNPYYNNQIVAQNSNFPKK